MKKPEHVLPADIERTSMSIIMKELRKKRITVPKEHEAVILRAIHASADFDYAKNLKFTEGAVEKGIAALSAGDTVIITDSNMALAGISKPALKKLRASAFCFTGEKETAKRAEENGTTRAAAGFSHAVELYPRGIFVTGNAPTALLYLAEEIRKGLRPSLVIGIPVGFVNVCESKEEIMAVCKEHNVPAIAAMGRKGGSNVAAAVVNALLYTASGTLDPSMRRWQG